MQITVNINMVGLKEGNVRIMNEFLSAIQKFEAKVIVSIDSCPMSIGRLENKRG